MGRANGASVFAECGLHDCYARATRPPFKTVETLPQGNKQRVVGIRYATADHDDFRVEDINEAANGGRQRLERGRPPAAGTEASQIFAASGEPCSKALTRSRVDWN